MNSSENNCELLPCQKIVYSQRLQNRWDAERFLVCHPNIGGNLSPVEYSTKKIQHIQNKENFYHLPINNPSAKSKQIKTGQKVSISLTKTLEFRYQ